MAFCECSLAPIPDLVDLVDLDGNEPFKGVAECGKETNTRFFLFKIGRAHV